MYLYILSFLIVSVLSFAKPQKVPPKEGEIGEFFWRPATKDIVKLMKNSMNERAEPCEDFYEYACGNFGKKSNYSPHQEIALRVNKLRSDFVLNKMSKIEGSKTARELSTLLQGCIDNNVNLTMRQYYEELQQQFANTSMDDVLNILHQMDLRTVFATQVTMNKTNPVVLVFSSDEFVHASKVPFVNSLIDKLIKDEELATRVKEFSKQIVELMSPFDGDRLNNLIKEVDDTVWRAFNLVKATYSLAKYGTDIEGDRTRNCTSMLLNSFPLAVTSMVAKELLPEELTQGINELHHDLVESMVEMLEKQEWMGAARKNAMNKTQHGETWFGISDDLLGNYDELDALYEGFHVDQDLSFLEQWRQVLLYKEKAKIELVNKSLKEYKLYRGERAGLYGINAFNLVGMDVSVYTADILQSPLFHYRFPDFYRYGLFGFVFGHEYGHGMARSRIPGPFFTDGAVVSQSGFDEFAKRADCLVDQFDNQTVTTVEGKTHKLSGIQYLNENIADNTGYNVAFKAYKKAVESNKRTKILSELDELTSDQLFFVSQAQFFCTNVNDAYWTRIKRDSHAPPPNRVNAVRNSDDFAKAFQCPVGSKMNPEKKCRLWD